MKSSGLWLSLSLSLCFLVLVVVVVVVVWLRPWHTGPPLHLWLLVSCVLVLVLVFVFVFVFVFTFWLSQHGAYNQCLMLCLDHHRPVNACGRYDACSLLDVCVRGERERERERERMGGRVCWNGLHGVAVKIH